MAGRPWRRRAAWCIRVSLMRFPARSSWLVGPKRPGPGSRAEPLLEGALGRLRCGEGW